MFGNYKALIKRFPIPTPYPIGDVYCYLIKDDPITLIDVGVDTPEARQAWERYLKEENLQFSDIKRIVLTHGHSDHYGLAVWMCEKSNAKLFVHPLDWPKVMDRKGFYERLLPYMEEYGIPQSYFETFIKILLWEKNFCKDIPEDLLNPLSEKDTLEFEHFSLEVIHVPGHSLGHIVLFKDGWALSGDFIFQKFTPIPVIEVDKEGNRIKTMLLYMESLEKMKKKGLRTYWPSHREFEGDYQQALDALKERMKRKEELILECIKNQGKCTAFDVLKCLYPDHKPSEVYVLSSEVLGRLDFLEHKGLVKCQKESGHYYYSLP
ncbi:MBL fold metallo-hydrolase [Thermosulfidibacter takaii]|nr:MBL fold metallo-hydrolase [Thermosulfidibacter takaii]